MESLLWLQPIGYALELSYRLLSIAELRIRREDIRPVKLPARRSMSRVKVVARCTRAWFASMHRLCAVYLVVHIKTRVLSTRERTAEKRNVNEEREARVACHSAVGER